MILYYSAFYAMEKFINNVMDQENIKSKIITSGIVKGVKQLNLAIF